MATEVVDDINEHLSLAREFDRAALLPGMYLAWCARLNLLNPVFAQSHAQELLRLHYNDGSCIELFVTGCAGTLRYEHLNEQGAAFTRGYYPRYITDWKSLFGADIYSVPDNWQTYETIARLLTPKLLGQPEASGLGESQKAWWRFWQKDSHKQKKR